MRLLAAFFLFLFYAFSVGDAAQLSIGSKKFTESVILGELATVLALHLGEDVDHRRQLGGTQVLFGALKVGEIDVYPEYTGTISQEILAGQGLSTYAELSHALSEMGILMSLPLGFNNTYALGMDSSVAIPKGIETISDLIAHPDLALGFSNEFMDREDGWPGLKGRYGLSHKKVRGLDHDLAYRGLESGSINVMDLYTTDAEIAYYGLHVLKDDRGYFPEYQAVWLYRADLESRLPDFVRALKSVEWKISAPEMVAMNARAKLERVQEALVAADFARKTLGISVKVAHISAVDRVWQHTLEHLFLVAISLSAAVLVAVPLGILAKEYAKFGQVILAVVGAIQTVPSLALLVFMIPLLGIGYSPAIAALFLYSLLPIVRNTYAGLKDIPQSVEESALALGLPRGARLRLVELPLASRSILAGIKTSAVINVGTATLGALIGAGGYGQPILTGIRLDDTSLILQGAIPAAALAFIMQGTFELGERLLVSKGLRDGG